MSTDTALILAGISLAGTAVLALKDVVILAIQRMKESDCLGVRIQMATPAVERVVSSPVMTKP